jgi:hypothetical protein
MNSTLIAPVPRTDGPSKVVTMTIEDDGTATFLKTDSADIFLECGEVITRRASHVEPAMRYERWAFHLLRTLFGESGVVSDWTRGWKTLWRVNTKPVGGPILTWAHVYPTCTFCLNPQVASRIYVFSDRQKAIDSEIAFLIPFFAERKI